MTGDELNLKSLVMGPCA